MSNQAQKRAEETARKVHDYLVRMARRRGDDPRYVALLTPELTQQKGLGIGWSVCWEEGPFEWAHVIPLGNLIDTKVLAEPFNGFVINFIE